jgi:hypothetical protein
VLSAGTPRRLRPGRAVAAAALALGCVAALLHAGHARLEFRSPGPARAAVAPA